MKSPPDSPAPSDAPKSSRQRKAPPRPRSKPRPRDAKKDRTRKQILDAALELFRTKGFEATTTRQISKKAGIAEGTLFNYFKTKDDLALYFFQKETDGLIAWFRAEKRLQKAPLAEKLFAILHRQLEYIEPYEDFIGAVLFRALQPSSKLSPLSLDSQELRVRYLRFLRDVLSEAEAKGEVPPIGDLGAYAVGLFYIGIVAHWLHDESKGKQRTLALLDRSLGIASRMARKGAWDW